MELGMQSLENIAVMQLSVQIIKSPSIKKVIFPLRSTHFVTHEEKYFWYKKLETETEILMEKLYLRHYKKKVVGNVLLLGLKMLSWIAHQTKILNLQTYSNIDFLSSCFTHQGIIDIKMAARYLMNDENLNVVQKYKLACIYCFENDIPPLFISAKKEYRKKYHNYCTFLRIEQPPIIDVWTYYYSGEIETLTCSEKIYEYMLDKSIESGSLAAVDYALTRMNFRKNSILVEAAHKAVTKCGYFNDCDNNDHLLTFDEWKYKCARNPWAPSEYHAEIVLFLVSKMSRSEYMQFMCSKSYFYCFDEGCRTLSKMLELFLNWPYQNYFMKAVNRMWEYLPESEFADLLNIICRKINCRMLKCKRYAENMSYNYKQLLWEFWCQSPESHKKSIFAEDKYNRSRGICILFELLSQKNLTKGDIENIRAISSFASDKQKEDLFKRLVYNYEWMALHELIMHNILSEDKIISIKKSVCDVSGDGMLKCVKYITCKDWERMKSFLRWCRVSEEDINTLKRDIVPVVVDNMNETSHRESVEVSTAFVRTIFLLKKQNKTNY